MTSEPTGGSQKNILIIGGYGVFGGRLARLLGDEDRLTLIIAGRSKANADAFCCSFPSHAGKRPQFFDRDGDIEKQLDEIKPDLVIDATGPFQNYGTDPYRVIKACLNLGLHYMDFADGADFVKVVSQFNDDAKKKNILFYRV